MSNVESPNHYTAGYFETIYEIRDVLGGEGFKAFCIGNYIKYNARANHKGLKAEDLAKADQYLEWAVNGLPAPVDGRVPRQDIYKQFADAMAGPTQATACEAQPEREVKSNPALAAGYAIHEAADATKARHESAAPVGAKSVANAIMPVIEDMFGKGIFRRLRIDVSKQQCEVHEEHVFFVVTIHDRRNGDRTISESIIMDAEPDEFVCTVVGQRMAEDIKEYLAG